MIDEAFVGFAFMLLVYSIVMLVALCMILRVLKSTDANIVVLLINFTSSLIPMIMVLVYGISLFSTRDAGTSTYFNVESYWMWLATDSLSNLAMLIFILILWFISSKNSTN